jgi:HSP20 family protein
MFRPFQDPQLSLGALQDEMNRLFERVWHGGVSTRPFDGQPWAPAIDLFEFDDRYVVFAEVPGISPESVEVSCLNNTLTLRGEKRRAAEIKDETSRLHERRFGTFCRCVDLPGEVDADRASAKFQHGVLEVTVPKSSSARAKNIRVDVKEGEKPVSRPSSSSNPKPM